MWNTTHALLPEPGSYLSNRIMSVKFNGIKLDDFEMPRGGTQGTEVGMIDYISNLNDNANCVDVKVCG